VKRVREQQPGAVNLTLAEVVMAAPGVANPPSFQP